MTSSKNRPAALIAFILGLLAVLADIIPILWIFKDHFSDALQQFLYPGILIYLFIPAFFVAVAGIISGRRAMNLAQRGDSSASSPNMAKAGLALSYIGLSLSITETVVATIVLLSFYNYCRTAPTGCF